MIVAVGPDGMQGDRMSERRTGAALASAWTGIVGAVLFTAGVIMVSQAPGGGEPKAKDFPDFYDSSGKRATVLVGAYVLAFGCLVLLAFFNALRHRIVERGGGLTTDWGHKAAIFGLTSVAVSAGLLGAPAAVQTFGKGDYVGIHVAHAFAEAGFGIMLIPGMLGIALAVFTLSLGGRRTGALQGWLGITGMVVAVLLLASLFFVPLVLFPLWLLVTGIASLRTRDATSA